MGGQCVDLASSKRLVVQLLSTQAEGMELSLGTSQQESPGTGIQHRNVGSSGDGAGFLPLRSSYGWHKSEFLVCEPLPRCEQRPTGPARSNSESVPRALVERPLGGHSWSVSSRAGLRRSREMGGAVGGGAACSGSPHSQSSHSTSSSCKWERTMESTNTNLFLKLRPKAPLAASISR